MLQERGFHPGKTRRETRLVHLYRITGVSRKNPVRPNRVIESRTSAIPKKRPLKANFGPGFQLETDDEEFRLQIHVLSQVEARVWGRSDQFSANDGFFFPRQRFFFNGRITKPIEYVFSINRGLNSLDLLDAFLNFHFDDGSSSASAGT